MAMTVRQALSLAPLAAGDPVVLSGEDRLDTDLRWVHVSEVRDVGAVLVGHELVLTTGIAMAASPQAAADFRADVKSLVGEQGVTEAMLDEWASQRAAVSKPRATRRRKG